MRKDYLLLAILLVSLFLAGCGVKAETEQEKYYRKANESQQKAKEIGNKAADSILNMDTSTKSDTKPQKK